MLLAIPEQHPLFPRLAFWVRWNSWQRLVGAAAGNPDHFRLPSPSTWNASFKIWYTVAIWMVRIPLKAPSYRTFTPVLPCVSPVLLFPLLLWRPAYRVLHTPLLHNSRSSFITNETPFLTTRTPVFSVPLHLVCASLLCLPWSPTSPVILRIIWHIGLNAASTKKNSLILT